MSEPLDAVLALAADGSPVTCTLSPESVQVIFYALGFMYAPGMWIQDFGDTVSEDDWNQIQVLLGNVTQELLP